MRRLELAPQAERDAEAILDWSSNEFGTAAAARYSALIRQALVDLQIDAARPGVNALPEFGETVFYYRLQFSCRNVPQAAGRVKASPHLAVFRIRPDDSIEIGRILHEKMQLKSSIPDQFRSGS